LARKRRLRERSVLRAAGRRARELAAGRLGLAALAAAGVALAIPAALVVIGGSRPSAPARTAGAVILRDRPALADGPAIGERGLGQGGETRALLFTAAPARLAASGGVVQIDAVVAGAIRCQLAVRPRVKPLPLTRQCADGKARARVKIAANASGTPRSYDFTLTVDGAHGRRVTRRVSVVESAGSTPPGPTPTTSSQSANSAPAITGQPSNATVAAGSEVTFTAAASGAPPPAVQWQVSTDGGQTWTQISGATSTTYSFAASADENGNQYRAVFSNVAGSATTAAATLTVTVAPQITTQPSDVTAVVGGAASFTATASGLPTPTVQWQLSTDGGGTWSAIPGATSATYTVTANAGESGSEYEAVFTNTVGSVTSTAATLTVTLTPLKPAITAQPTNDTVAAGDAASFTATASGSPTPAVQWQVSTDGGHTRTQISGATSTTYSFTASSAENGSEYEAVFTNVAGSATTDAATLTVEFSAAPQITTEPSNQSVLSGATATFTAAASGSPAPGVQWQVSTNGGGTWGDVSGAASTTYSFTTSEAENTYEYRAVFTNAAGSATTSAATLMVLAGYSNWSGYVATGATFSAVSGSWIVPSVTCSHSTTYSAHWIGIDGYSSDSVEQDGSEADCSGGSASYDAWYEMYGDSSVDSGNEVELSPASYPVHPGNAMSAQVSVSGETWTLAIADTSAGWSYSTQIGWPGAAQSSAEWVGERPEICLRSCSLASLADFGSLSFTGASATAGATTAPISSWSFVPMEMEGSSGDALAVPGPLGASGNSFTITWEASS